MDTDQGKNNKSFKIESTEVFMAMKLTSTWRTKFVKTDDSKYHGHKIVTYAVKRNYNGTTDTNRIADTSYTQPCSIIESATFKKPAMFAPTCRFPGLPYFAADSLHDS